MNEQKGHFRSTLIAGAMLLLLLLTLGGVAAAQGEDPGGNVSSKSMGILRAAPPRPWTSQELIDAVPYPLPQREAPISATEVMTPFLPGGEPGFAPSTLPVGFPPATKAPKEPSPAPAPFAGATNGVAGYDYPPPFERYAPYATPRSLFPLMAVGRLFFTQGGVRYSCSAASIGNYAVWTAGHCIHAGDGSADGWSSNVIFVPAYHNGRAPFGQWAAVNLWTKQGWYASGDFRYDMAGATLKKLGGRKISQRVGALGFAWNQGLKVHWHAVGYPAGDPFDGSRQYVCTASYATSDLSMGEPAPSGMGCDMTGGSSGGPWITGFSPSSRSGNFLNGNVSYGYLDEPLQMFSPYFDDDAKGLYDALVGDAP